MCVDQWCWSILATQRPDHFVVRAAELASKSEAKHLRRLTLDPSQGQQMMHPRALVFVAHTHIALRPWDTLAAKALP